MDRVQGCKLNVVLLGDFNTDMQKTNPACDCTISLFGLDHMITSPTRITPHSSTLIDHIYTSDASIVSNILVLATGISDHFRVCCTFSVLIWTTNKSAVHSNYSLYTDNYYSTNVF